MWLLGIVHLVVYIAQKLQTVLFLFIELCCIAKVGMEDSRNTCTQFLKGSKNILLDQIHGMCPSWTKFRLEQKLQGTSEWQLGEREGRVRRQPPYHHENLSVDVPWGIVLWCMQIIDLEKRIKLWSVIKVLTQQETSSIHKWQYKHWWQSEICLSLSQGSTCTACIIILQRVSSTG